jgi:hypothetical protein
MAIGWEFFRLREGIRRFKQENVGKEIYIRTWIE